jgi:hypothetical protein
VSIVLPAGIDTPIAGHAAVHADGGALIPPPVYDPQLVADAILDCVVTGRREITVGGIGRAQVLFSEHFPALFEWLAPLATKALTTKAKAQPKPDNLGAPQRAGEEHSPDQPGRPFSVYTTAAKHPLAVIGVGAMLAIGLAALTKQRGSKNVL